MQILTKQNHLDSISERWDAQYMYATSRAWKPHHKIGDKLRALPKPVRAEDVDTIIGNTSWTTFKCDMCWKPVELLVVMGNDENSTCVCKQCVGAAFVALAKEGM